MPDYKRLDLIVDAAQRQNCGEVLLRSELGSTDFLAAMRRIHVKGNLGPVAFKHASFQLVLPRDGKRPSDIVAVAVLGFECAVKVSFFSLN